MTIGTARGLIGEDRRGEYSSTTVNAVTERTIWVWRMLDVERVEVLCCDGR